MEALAGWVVLGSLGLTILMVYGACRLAEWTVRRRRERRRRVRLELTRWLEGRR